MHIGYWILGSTPLIDVVNLVSRYSIDDGYTNI
jgi:hypothetical protein